jgi:hypothetical protein
MQHVVRAIVGTLFLASAFYIAGKPIICAWILGLVGVANLITNLRDED